MKRSVSRMSSAMQRSTVSAEVASDTLMRGRAALGSSFFSSRSPNSLRVLVTWSPSAGGR